MPPRLPGKPRKVDRDFVIGVIKKRKSEILRPDKKIVSKLDPVWQLISSEIDNKLTAGTLYAMVCKPTIRQQLLSFTGVGNDSCLPQLNISDGNNGSVTSSESFENDSSVEPGSITFTVWANQEEFNKLLEKKVYKRRKITRNKQYERSCTILRPGLWQEWITNEIWKATKLQCAFNFHNSRVTQDGRSGTINGTCNCGSALYCKIENGTDNFDKNTRIDCTVKKGQGKCGKRYLRAPIRNAIGEDLRTKSAVVYRAEKADALMMPGDPEAPHLYKKSVLNNAKYELLSAQYLDRDPIRALQIMKLGALQNSLHGIGLDPFYLHYWTNHQLHLWRAYAKRESACLSIDATGGIVKTLERCDESNSRCIFLYHAVVHSSTGQFSVSQMLSEKHTTVAITYWLAEWVSQATVYPKEIVCDSSKALLAASVKAFTGHNTIEEYANACNNSVIPPCYVRIDVAHFIKMYANFLKSSPKRIKTFYLAILGQLIQSRDISSAGAMLKSILIIARSETDGNLPSGQQTQCEVQKNRMKNSINPGLEANDEDAPIAVLPEGQSIFDDDKIVNFWSSWGTEIDLEARKLTNEEGDHDNAHFLPGLADRLLNDIRWFPLWSSVCRDRFGYGRIPATSASVESGFNIIKSHVLKNDPKPLRADIFVQKHLGYISGRTKIIGAQVVPSGHNISESVDGITNLNDSDPDDPAEVTIPASNNDTGALILNGSPNKDEDSKKFTVTASKLKSKLKSKFISQSCMLCSEPVADLSVKKEDQGPICVECTKTATNIPEILTSREMENWRGLTSVTTKKKTRYLDNNHTTFDAISMTKLTKIPIMKNGNNVTMQASKSGNEQYSFTKTCAFDSILHVILVAAMDRQHVNDAVCRLLDKNSLLHLVVDILKNGLRAHSYRLRANILIDIHPILKSNGNSHLIDCATNVCYLVSRVFVDTPSVEETSTCTNGCEPRVKRLRTVSIPQDVLFDPSRFKNFLTTYVALAGSRRCPNSGCDSGVVTTVYSATGPFILIEMTDNHRMSLGNIPRNFDDPMSDRRQFTLIGVVDFQPSKFKTRSSTDLDLDEGHYTAIILRPPSVWIEVNDLKEKPLKLSSNYNAQPHMLIYIAEDL